MRLGIDASDLLSDRSGKARHLQPVLALLATDSRVEVTLLASRENFEALALRYAHTDIQVAHHKAAKKDHFEVVWFPWNTIRFATKSPKVVTINDVIAMTHPAKNFFTRGREKKALRYTAREATQIVVPSAWAREECVDVLKISEDRTTVIRPMPDSRWHPALEAAPYPGLDDMPFIVIVPDTRGPQHLKMFFEAFAQAFKKRNVRLVYCGSVPKKLHKQFAALPHASVVEADDAQLRALFRNAAAVAVTATADGFNAVAAEASACGAAVLAANAAALPEIVGESAMLVDPEKRRRWTRALEDIVVDETMNARIRAKAVSEWSNCNRSGYVDEILAVCERARKG